MHRKCADEYTDTLVLNCCNWGFNHQTMVFACISLWITSISPQVTKIRHCNTGFSCLSGALGKQFGFIEKKGFACWKCTAFGHSSMYKHPCLSGLPALLLLPFLPTLQEHLFLAIAPFADAVMQKHLYLVRGTYGLGNFNERRWNVLQWGAHLPFLSLGKPNPALSVGLPWSSGLVSLAGISPSACCAECGSPT